MNTCPKSIKVMATIIAIFVVVYLSQILAWMTVPILKVGAVLSALWVIVDMIT